MNIQQRDVLIVGSGPAGCTAALYLSRAGYKPLVLHGNTPGGQLTGTTFIENFPAFSGQGPHLMQTLEDQATNAGAEFEYETVVDVDFGDKIKRVNCESGTIYEAKSVLICTGAEALYLGLPNEQRLIHRGVSGCATCDGPIYRGQDVVVVGGGDSAAEEAIFLSHLCNTVTLVHRRGELRASLPMKKKLENSKVLMKWFSTIEDVIGEENVEGVVIRNVETEELTTLKCSALFVAIGHRPATKPFKMWLETDPQGYFITSGSPRTKIPGVFVAGDCADPIYRQAITSAGEGCKAALLSEKYLQDVD